MLLTSKEKHLCKKSNCPKHSVLNLSRSLHVSWHGTKFVRASFVSFMELGKIRRKTPKYRLRHLNNESRQQIGALDSLKMIRPQLSAHARSDGVFLLPTSRLALSSVTLLEFRPLRDNSRAIQIAERRLGTNAGPVRFFPRCHEFRSIRSQDENYVKLHHLIRIRRRNRKLVRWKLKENCDALESR